MTSLLSKIQSQQETHGVLIIPQLGPIPVGLRTGSLRVRPSLAVDRHRTMAFMDAGSLVIVHCTNPREKMWGQLLRLDATGVVIRGMDLDSVEDWLRQERSGGPTLIGPSTFFIPCHRLVRVDLDESSEVIASYGDRYRQACGRPVEEALEAPRNEAVD